MKQAIDTFTRELPGLGDSLTQGATTPSKHCFSFYIRTASGATTEWTGLTAKRAKDMYAYTQQSQPSNVTAFGWKEEK
jgi:hypothetical protein